MAGEYGESSNEKKSFYSSLPKSFTTVTQLSKFIALVLFVTLSFGGFYLGMKYQQLAVSTPGVSEVQKPVTLIPTPDPTANWKTYTSTTYGFSLRYPVKLNYKESDSSTVLFTNSSEISEFPNYLNMKILDGTKVLTDELGKYFTVQQGGTWKDIKIGSYTGSYIETVGVASGYVATVNTGKYFFIFQLADKDKQQFISNDDFFQILSTFKFAAQNQTGCNTDNDCQNGAKCMTVGPMIANQPVHKVCVQPGQVIPL